MNGQSKSTGHLAKSNNSLNKTGKAESKYFDQAKKFTQFKESEIDLFVAQFKSFDKDGNGVITKNELAAVCREMGENVSADDLAKKVAEVDLNNNNVIEFDEFLQVIAKLKEGRVGADRGFGAIYQKQARLVKIGGATESTTHSINEDEQEQFVLHINEALKNDADVKSHLPIDPHSFGDLYEKVKDGLLLAKLINDSVPETIDTRVLNKIGGKGQLNTFQKTENQNVVVNSAKAIGCSVVNIGAQDLIEGREILVLGLVWQIIKIGLFAKVDLKYHPELFRLLEQGETLDDLFKLPTDQILLRWFNYHLKKAGHNRKVTNFTSDIKDSENYTVLLHQLVPEKCTKAPMQEKDLKARAELMLKEAEKIDCRKYVTPKAVAEGNQKLNMAFVANLFNHHPGLEPLSATEMAALDEWLFASKGDREARTFALWLNSLGVDPFVNSLYDDLRDGTILLQAMDKIHPGEVDWKRVTKGPKPIGRFKALENCNYVTELGLRFKYSLVGIQGADITDGSKKLTLSIVWQLMRDNVIQMLKSVSKEGKDVTEDDMVNWANTVPGRVGKTSQMSSFKDPSLKTSVFFLDLLNGIKKGIVDYSIVTPGETDESAKSNAKYAISIARKLGATIFVLPEDLLEVRPKMILTFVGALMALDKKMVSSQ